MAKLDLVMFEEEYKLLQEIIGRLQKDAQAKVVFLVDKNGQQIAASGDLKSIDATSLASCGASTSPASSAVLRAFEMRSTQLMAFDCAELS